MQRYHKTAIVGNISHNPLSITFAAGAPPDVKPGRATRTEFTMIHCRACGAHWRVEAGTGIWEFRYAHAGECLDLLDRFALHLARIGVERFIRRRARIIGAAIITERIIHRQGRELTVCDSRCQKATGANCDCRCLGAQHGISHAR
jgi:hypothetical protein